MHVGCEIEWSYIYSIGEDTMPYAPLRNVFDVSCVPLLRRGTRLGVYCQEELQRRHAVRASAYVVFLFYDGSPLVLQDGLLVVHGERLLVLNGPR